MTPDAAAALLALHLAVEAAGGDLRVTDCLRDVATQAAMRARYERWVTAGKPTNPPGFDAKTMKRAFVARPGRSFHNAGRSVDLHVAVLAFPNTPADQQLDRLWAIAVPLGWRPIIKAPSEQASEAWHFDYLGPWASVVDALDYEQGAIAAVVDIGNDDAFPKDGAARRVQAELHRAGFAAGGVDGILGPACERALRGAGYTGSVRDLDRAIAFVDALADAAA